MDPQVAIIVMALEAELERKRREITRMEKLLRALQVALREKVRERAMLMRKKKAMLAKEAAQQKLVDDFMVFIEATEENGAENGQNFDEKAMMNAIRTMMNSDDGGHSSDD